MLIPTHTHTPVIHSLFLFVNRLKDPGNYMDECKQMPLLLLRCFPLFFFVYQFIGGAQINFFSSDKRDVKFIFIFFLRAKI
jgi:hypothetical protein